MKESVAGRMAFFAREEFDKKFRYDGKDLGAVCRENRTVFKVWSPLAERIKLRLYRDGVSESFLEEEMQAGERGVWSLAFQESLHGIYYDYVVKTQGKDTRTADPYATGCGCNGERSMVVDLSLTNPPGFEADRAPQPCGEQIIYELHIKDFSYDKDSGIPEVYRGKYKAFTVMGTGENYPTCMEYLKSLGVTHVHLLPFFDFGSVDEAGDGEQFNWGYDPKNYNVPEGSYATDAVDGAVRIRECKEMIQAFHKNGIRVVMDVVYNHTYKEDSWFQRMVPDYYYRYGEDGRLSNGSACGNDIAAGRAMVDNYIADSVMYWASEYHIDGFRFDLMGLLTVDLMNRIRRELDDRFGAGEKILYGEPWSADFSPMEEGTMAADKGNAGHLEDGVAIFSDDTRDAIKGSVFEGTDPGFVNGGEDREQDILHAVSGWRDGGTCFLPKSCRQIVNYVSAHDNFTLWDKLVISMRGEEGDFDKKYEDVLAANKLAAFIYFTCQGNLFLQAGEEFGRTKQGEDNSFCSSPELNMLKWSRTVEYGDLVEYYKGLIRLRKRLPGLCDKSPDAAERISCRTVHREGVVSFRVDNRGSGSQEVCNQGSGKGGSCSQGSGNGDSADSGDSAGSRARADSRWEELFVIYNGSGEDAVLLLPVCAPETARKADRAQGSSKGVSRADIKSPDEQPGFWEVLADGQEADCRKRAQVAGGSVRVPAHSGMLLGLVSFVRDGAGEGR